MYNLVSKEAHFLLFITSNLSRGQLAIMSTLGIKSLVRRYQYKINGVVFRYTSLYQIHVSNFKGGFSSMPVALLFASWGCKMTTQVS